MHSEVKLTLKELFGVTGGSQEKWLAAMASEQERLDTAADKILERHMREAANGVCQVVSDIRANCVQDPDDIREEIALPALVRRVSEVLEDYARFAAKRNIPAQIKESMGEALAFTRDTQQRLEALLERMRANDDRDFTLRTQVISGVFRRIAKEYKQGEGPNES